MGLREINETGLALIKRYEAPPPKSIDAEGHLHPYIDPVQVWTIGWGHAIDGPAGRHLVGESARTQANALYPDGLTSDQANDLLRADLLTASSAVVNAVTTDLRGNEFAALVSFTFNVGAGNLRRSTLLRCLNDGDRFAAANQFGRWVLAQGQRLAGLVDRRRAERELFLTPDDA